MEDARVRASISAYERFLSSLVWLDMKTELEDWKRLAAQEYDIATDITQIKHVQGRREAIDYMLQLPEMLQESLETALLNNSTKEHENEDG